MPASRSDLVVAYNGNHDIHLAFENDHCDGTTSPADMTGYTCHFAVKRNNYDQDSEMLARRQVALTSDKCTFSLTPDEINAMGEGVHWYDIWLTAEDDGDYNRPVLYGTYTVQILTTRDFCSWRVLISSLEL